jgi:hypothetical protein
MDKDQNVFKQPEISQTQPFVKARSSRFTESHRWPFIPFRSPLFEPVAETTLRAQGERSE